MASLSSMIVTGSLVCLAAATSVHATARLTGHATRDVALGPFTPFGCYIDGINGRALSLESYADDAMTVKSCFAFCSQYQFFGVEYGRECFCGNTLDAPRSTGCTTPCAGNADETCGAASRLDVYVNTGYVDPKPAVVPGTTYLGCYVDQDPHARILPSNLLGADDMTAAKCKAHCAGYAVFGLEYGRECWCGNTFPATTAKAPATDCTFPCAGNSAEVCGAHSRINVWAVPATPTYIDDFLYFGCFVDSGSALHTLTGEVYYNSAMTLDKCAAFCHNYPKFGVEHGSQCFCGSDVTWQVPRPEAECAMACGGNALQLCGGADRLSIYSRPCNGEGENLSNANEFVYKACWTDNGAARSLTGDSFSSAEMTVVDCAAFCRGYLYFGVEFGSQCFCGDVLGGHAAAEEDCEYLCEGDNTQWCGSANRLSVYEVYGI
ncbi:WSC domain-containing protein [Podospora appendiculata]|uniref:WSC domain-containing protein n=1 Tax=Podospora appendiculata TaxID=314037 RepID=A0AAE1CIE5_9PEZI|nr:WSC domain-containing protein [Podospora appendiculata]